MTNYTGFINAMLELRNQRLKESMFRAQQQQEEMAALGRGIGGAIGGIGQGFGRNAIASRQDALANQLMTQNSSALGGQPIMRAQSVDPSLQAGADAGMRQMPGFYTGGVDELKMRMSLMDQRNQNMGGQLAQDRFGYEKYKDQRDFKQGVTDRGVDDYRQERALQAQIDAQKAAQVDRDADNARQKAQNATKGLKDDFNDMESYHASMTVHQNDMRDAPDKYSYDNAARSAHSLWSAAKKRGLDVGDAPPEIAPYLTPTQRQAIALQQAEASTKLKELQDAKEAVPGMLDWAKGMIPGLQSKDEAIKAAQESYNMEQGTLESLQKGGSPFDPNAAAPAAATQGGGGSAPEGTEVTNAQGQTLVKRGGKWVPK